MENYGSDNYSKKDGRQNISALKHSEVLSFHEKEKEIFNIFKFCKKEYIVKMCEYIVKMVCSMSIRVIAKEQKYDLQFLNQ